MNQPVPLSKSSVINHIVIPPGLRRGFAISGRSGTGKGETTRVLATTYGLTSVSAGNIMRRLKEQAPGNLDLEVGGDSPFMDWWIDTMVLNAVLNNSTGVVAEGRLVPYVVPTWVYKVQLTLRDEVRFARIAKRDKITVDQATHETLRRERLMEDRFRRLHGFQGDLFDTSYVHQVIDTGNLAPEVVVQQIVEGATLFFASGGNQPEIKTKLLPFLSYAA